MTLTNTGRLGIGDTQPNETLTVSGVCTISSNTFVGANLSVSGNTTIGGNLTLGGILNITSGSLESNLTGDVIGNIRAVTGISSFFKVGINTDVALSSLSLDASQCNAGFRNVGIGSTEPDSILRRFQEYYHKHPRNLYYYQKYLLQVHQFFNQIV